MGKAIVPESGKQHLYKVIVVELFGFFLNECADDPSDILALLVVRFQIGDSHLQEVLVGVHADIDVGGGLDGLHHSLGRLRQDGIEVLQLSFEALFQRDLLLISGFAFFVSEHRTNLVCDFGAFVFDGTEQLTHVLGTTNEMEFRQVGLEEECGQAYNRFFLFFLVLLAVDVSRRIFLGQEAVFHLLFDSFGEPWKFGVFGKQIEQSDQFQKRNCFYSIIVGRDVKIKIQELVYGRSDGFLDVFERD